MCARKPVRPATAARITERLTETVEKLDLLLVDVSTCAKLRNEHLKHLFDWGYSLEDLDELVLARVIRDRKAPRFLPSRDMKDVERDAFYRKGPVHRAQLDSTLRLLRWAIRDERRSFRRAEKVQAKLVKMVAAASRAGMGRSVLISVVQPAHRTLHRDHLKVADYPCLSQMP